MTNPTPLTRFLAMTIGNILGALTVIMIMVMYHQTAFMITTVTIIALNIAAIFNVIIYLIGVAQND